MINSSGLECCFFKWIKGERGWI